MAYASIKTGRRSDSTPGAVKLLINALSTASSTGTHYQVELDRCYSNFAFQVVTGSTKADKATLQASLDGSNWSNIASSTFAVATVGSGGIIWVTSKPALHVRAVVTASPSTKPMNAWIAPGL